MYADVINLQMEMEMEMVPPLHESKFVKIIDALTGINSSIIMQDHKQSKHKDDRYLMEDNKLWQFQGFTLTHTLSLCNKSRSYTASNSRT